MELSYAVIVVWLLNTKNAAKHGIEKIWYQKKQNFSEINISKIYLKGI